MLIYVGIWLVFFYGFRQTPKDLDRKIVHVSFGRDLNPAIDRFVSVDHDMKLW